MSELKFVPGWLAKMAIVVLTVFALAACSSGSSGGGSDTPTVTDDDTNTGGGGGGGGGGGNNNPPPNWVFELRIPNCTRDTARDLEIGPTGRVAVARVDC